LEDILRTSKDIADVAVVGVRHERLGEAPRAFIVLKPNAKLTENQVHDFLERKIAPHKKLAGGVQFIDQIPKALSGKILRKEIVRLYIDK
jgi:4-coumarate--CoA ligase